MHLKISSMKRLPFCLGGDDLTNYFSFNFAAILPKDCGDIQQQGSRYSGLYTVYPKNLPMQGLEVFCDLDTAGGGWLVSTEIVQERCQLYWVFFF